MTAFEQLKQKLHEIFQLDKRELDFGIYRIMNLKADEIASFIDNDLLAQVKSELENYTANDNKEIKEQLEKTIATLKETGVKNIEELPKIKELRAKLAQSFDAKKTETEIYSDLYNFFKRYYSEGDFLSLRRYKEGVYALPYEGEEVKLYWANADQYYIKSSETLTNYTFKAGPHKIRFEVTDATTEQNNNKGKDDRRFKLLETNPVRKENGEYIISFSYLSDPQKPNQKGLNEQAAQALLQNSVLADCREELRAERGAGKAKSTLLGKHLDDFTAKNTFDYFIHKNLGKFLRRELDFYIKNEMMHLDDIETENALRVEQYLAKIKVFRKIAGKIITFLASLEDFQKKLWLKKKFVLETNYCITLDRVPEELYEEIAQNDAQREEWVKLFAINEIEQDTTHVGYSVPLTIQFLKENPFLVLDTAFFSIEFKYKLLARIDDLDKNCDGLLIHSENFQALNLLQEKYREKVQCIYIDPPFNTENDTDFLYKDNYQTSSWLSLMCSRFQLMKPLITTQGSCYLHLDENADFLGRLLLENIFTDVTNEIIWNKGFRGTESKNIYQHSHDTVFYLKNNIDNAIWNNPAQPYKDENLGRYNQIDENGKKFALVKRTRTNGEVYYGKVYPKEGGKHANDVISHIPTMASTNPERIPEFKTQKPEALLKFFIEASSNQNDLILDFFGGSGTTLAAAYKLRRKGILVEMGKYFDNIVIQRIKKALHGEKCGISDYQYGGLFKYIRLESYEDALDNLSFERTAAQKQLFSENKSIQEEYTLKYMMDLETKSSLLTVHDFNHPFDYSLNITRNGETKRVNVDLVETFNYLIGLEVHNIQESRGVVSVEGVTRNGEKVLVLWRDVAKTNNEALNTWFEKRAYSTQDHEFDIIYVNGDNNLENLRKEDETWKVRLTEAEFLKRMFDVQEA
ncbi:DNA methyltransferase [Candidatus Avelusimicrobium luingense]|uniref:DNA methyltransferase n=1 Tax=Candidatus Avelusimicrobium luingense TaxID=3416211 RepID=UPI003D124BAE